MDVIIPLGTGSRFDDMELRYALRSLERNALGLEIIHVVGEHVPDWIQGVDVVKIPDRHKDNKDANLHEKTLECIENRRIYGDFLWMSDDNAIIKKINMLEIPVLCHDTHPRDYFTSPLTKWRKRLLHTFEFGDKNNIHLQYHFDVHAPQVFNGKKLLDGMKNVDYISQPGLTIYTTWRIISNDFQGWLPQYEYKETIEFPQDAQLNKLFLGYNDYGAEMAFRALQKKFPKKSKYEKE